ncbi:hypothetical protein PTSG_05222 [Salpingoeca rosetta]|uniref:Folate receptor-like domain-containing protein n=1 Tax=Salpingoeca rosetta (strain ATCC 50818 / BSB-021) TaxID=946362 RepID=F2UAV2_SALR5|nr:uncharacterized protein PTSG_05222 [Salpingoeca rosetta]EGD73518.1 hypothetical protein PTSG_05222 [Salpingoeca rosetta]|eukprot:XP_004993800.1 hypothetical protein PTSG_05222 [Salpingoeca rosetta]
MKVATTVLLLAATAIAASAQVTKDDSLEAYEGHRTCFFTGVLPERPNALSFCNRFNGNACCVPGLDNDNHELFTTLTDVGLSCRLRGDIRDHPIARLYCLNCDPHQPNYVRPVAYTSPDGNTERDSTLLICKDWADEQFGDLGRFDGCGLLVSSPCLGEMGLEIDNYDRYVCGDDIVIPSLLKNDSLTDSQDVEVFLNFNSLGTPEMDGDYGFKLVRNKECTDAEAAETSPNCLMTAAQREMFRARFASVPANPADCDDAAYYNAHPDECVPLGAEMCFAGGRSSSSATTALASALAVVLAVLAVALV